ncbi:DUF4148 domain-containing protein [Paracidovorax wautersii]|uniref:DUF4148 domain-containing protein n=1 Tax=Paracidovorax wautersii TaxID=1177982 RepID=A0A1I2B574_9BURK|nr:DUF4148 domain-containing protein [Paracidovorax wautersii]SFE51048.1 protein of unknown function [Paracidovorax wautersii]
MKNNNTRRLPQIAFGAIGLSLLALSGAASANGYWHPANNEVGVTVHPDHFQSTKTREQVRAEAIEALRNGGNWQVTESGEPSRVPAQQQAVRQGRAASAAPQQQGTAE